VNRELADFVGENIIITEKDADRIMDSLVLKTIFKLQKESEVESLFIDEEVRIIYGKNKSVSCSPDTYSIATTLLKIISELEL
jgi:hypothetical protein